MADQERRTQAEGITVGAGLWRCSDGKAVPRVRLVLSLVDGDDIELALPRFDAEWLRDALVSALGDLATIEAKAAEMPAVSRG